MWQPFIFHPSFFPLRDKQREALRGIQFECVVCAYVHMCNVCVYFGGVSCQQGSQGKAKNLVVYVTPPASCGSVLIQRSPPCPPSGALKQLTQQLEHALKQIWLNVSLCRCHFSLC